MRAIKIDARKKECYYVEYTHDIKSIQEHLECTCFTTAGVRLPGKGDTLYVDDEGAINGTAIGFRFYAYSYDLFGHGIICGTDPEGYSQDVITDLDFVKSRVQFAITAFE